MNEERSDLRERTKQFALRIVKMYGALDKSTEQQVIGRQVLRSGTSVGANFREAHRSRSDAEFIAKLGDCLKELDETSYWIELLVDGEFVAETRMSELLDECNQLIAILTTIVKNTKQRMKDKV
ncbi:MAG: four helix bundle protein [Pirellulaceae bacterium]|nr:four helix bundle protein [Pirellulaceae bacterium]